ncbi:hypothetical protein BU23DRAFT_33978 [Bimuria novae-zelandiae CBS 107.79]|uniref:Uncharacterized protein n=1 Tax=Bimuria novae-zelandiae CBS 107.79 TaxID=1447943 RepID=A0A6A5UJZ4_9PLEO|nr:hypothetical protein BU23DRAFT_33978 [Bimuria novae-zelandiae CBS 107.79]
MAATVAGGRYTVEQLELLRESPLVKKPDALPSIEQWMDVPHDHGNNTNGGTTANRRTRTNLREPETNAAAEHRADRPLLGAMGQFSRRASTHHGDEPAIGGPPKLNFASATRAKPGQSKEATAFTSIDGEHLGDRFPRTDRWRDGDRTRDKEPANGRRPRREEGEGWQNVKGRKSLGQEDFDRGFGRNGDRDRKENDPENGDTLPRRRGDRWGRRDDTTKESEGGKFGATGQGGWRDRNREREKERDWTRGGGKAEEDPEWMDEPVPKKETKAHTQEDFQRWKEQMKAKDAPAEAKDEQKPELPAFFSDMLQPASSQQPPKSAITPSALEPNLGPMFGKWNTPGTETAAAEPLAAKPKPDKKSRFMNMFTKPEEPVAAAPPPAPAPASPGPPAADGADKEGFNRILQMLSGTNIGSTPAPQSSGPTQTNEIRPGGGISLDFHQTPPPPEMQERRPPSQHVPSQSSVETRALLDSILANRPSVVESRPSQQPRFNSMSPDNAHFEQFGPPRPESNRPMDESPYQQPPSRNHNPQDPNLAALLNSRSQVNRDKGSSVDRDFLLNLMQQPSRATPPQLGNQNLPRQPQESQNMSFYDQPRQQPKGHGAPPPGFMSERMDPRMDAIYLENELMRQEQERRNQVRELQQQEAMRHKNRGPPMGYPDTERDVMVSLQRRNTAGEIPRQLTNMGIPSQHVPDLPYMSGRQPGMPPTPQEGPNVRPPPGFPGPMRQPPGLGGPGPQHQMGPGPSFSAGNTPMGAPPGFNPGNNMRGGIFPGGPGVPGGNGMQGPPQGYFPPPQGYGPSMGLRGEDPRMMFEQQQFGGLGPRQQGRPPNMY